MEANFAYIAIIICASWAAHEISLAAQLKSLLLANFNIAVPVLWTLAVVTIGRFLPALSIKHSLKRLFGSESGINRLNILDIFRVSAISWVIVNHLGGEGRVDVLERRTSAVAFKQSIRSHPIFGALIGNSALGVEIFLVLSGLLAARSWNKCSASPFRRHYVVFLVRRIFRLLPSVAGFLLFAQITLKSFLPRFHSTMIESCGVTGFMSHLTFTNNLAATPTCLGYFWYLGLDMQMYLIAPVLLYLLQRRPRLGIALGVFLMSCSSFIRAVYCQMYDVCNKSDVDIPFISYPGEDPATLANVYSGLWEMYSRPHTKCGPFLIGLLLGHLLDTLKTSAKTIGRRRTRFLFFGALFTAVGTVYGILPEYWNPEQGNTVYNTLYTALFRNIFAAATATMILALYFTTARIRVNRVWVIFSKLTFSAFLVHMPVVYLFNHSQAFQQTQGVTGLLVALPFAILLSFAFALVFHCLVEAPLNILFNQILNRFLKL